MKRHFFAHVKKQFANTAFKVLRSDHFWTERVNLGIAGLLGDFYLAKKRF